MADQTQLLQPRALRQRGAFGGQRGATAFGAGGAGVCVRVCVRACMCVCACVCVREDVVSLGWVVLLV